MRKYSKSAFQREILGIFPREKHESTLRKKIKNRQSCKPKKSCFLFPFFFDSRPVILFCPKAVAEGCDYDASKFTLVYKNILYVQAINIFSLSLSLSLSLVWFTLALSLRLLPRSSSSSSWHRSSSLSSSIHSLLSRRRPWTKRLFSRA